MISQALAISILQCYRPGRSLRLNGQRMRSQVSDCLRSHCLSDCSRGHWLERILAEVRAALLAHWRSYMDNCTHCEQWLDGGEYIFPTLSITPAVGDWEEGGGQILPFSTSKLDTFQAAGKKNLYRVPVMLLNLASLSGYRESRWTEFFGPDVSPKGSWKCLYKLPIKKTER